MSAAFKTAIPRLAFGAVRKQFKSHFGSDTAKWKSVDQLEDTMAMQIAESIRDALLSIEADLRSKNEFDMTHSGTTAVVLLVIGSTVIVANVVSA